MAMDEVTNGGLMELAPPEVTDALSGAPHTIADRLGDCWLVEISSEHYVVIGPYDEEQTLDAVTLWSYRLPDRRWVATLEETETLLLTHLRPG